MITLALLQILLPSALLVIIALGRGRDLAGFIVRVLSCTAVLFALAYAGLWTTLPWWTPWALLALLPLAVLARLYRLPALALVWPQARRSVAASAIFLLLGVYALSLLVPAIRGRSPATDPVSLGAPLGPGTYLVVNGGNALAINAHLMTLDRSIPRFADWRGQSYALDLVQVNRWGFTARGIAPSDPAQYTIYGAPVIAPCNGTIKTAVDGIPDNIVPEMNRESMSGNHVIIACLGVEVLLAHFIPGSLTVAEGALVTRGDFIARVGNSGNSGEPHLHIHAQAPGAPGTTLATAPIPITIDGQYYVRNQRLVVSQSDNAM